IAAGVWRLNAGWPLHAGPRMAAGAIGVVALITGGAWTVGGPLKPGWSARAGTPAPLVAGAAGSKISSSAGSATALGALPLSTSVTATITTSSATSGQATVRIAGTGQRPISFVAV